MAMITPGTLNMDMYAGADFQYDLLFEIDGVPANLTGWDARFKARIDYAAAAAIIEGDVAGGEITLGGSTGTIQINVDNLATTAAGAALGNAKTPLVWDLELIDTTGFVTRLLQGLLTVWPEATRT